ncbi:TPA: hypothetical protein ACS7XF_002225 [Providencia alcalifaciens]
MDISVTTNQVNSLVTRPMDKSVGSQSNTGLPSVRGDITTNPQADYYQQATDALQQLGYQVPLPEFREQVISTRLSDIADQERDLVRGLRSSRDKRSLLSRHVATPVEDGRGHISGVSDLIDNVHNGYQKKYGELVKASTKYMQVVNSGLGKMSSSLESAPEGKIKLFKHRMINTMNDTMSGYFINNNMVPAYSDVKTSPDTNSRTMSILDGIYRNNPDGDKNVMLEFLTPLIVFDSDGNSGEFWKKKLQGQGFVTIEHNGKTYIYPDMAPLHKIYTAMNELIGREFGEIVISAQIFQSFQTAIDAQKNAINSSVSRLLETFRQDNSHFDTLVQLLIQLIKDLNQNNNSLINM